MKQLFYPLIILVVLGSCDPCDQCNEPLNFDPTVELIFINTDTIEGINDEITMVTAYLNELDESEALVDDKLDSLNLRLIDVNELIDNGDNSYEDERSDLLDLIDISNNELANYAITINETDSVQQFWKDLLADVSDGLIKIDTIFINGQYLVYTDSAKSYHTPLLMNEESFTEYKVIIGNYEGTISFDYELVESVDATREIKLRAFNIHPVSHTFESISDPECVTSECLDHETTVYLYF